MEQVENQSVLSAKQTGIFETFTKALSSIASVAPNTTTEKNIKIDTISISVDQIATEQQVNGLIKKVKEEVVNASTSKTKFAIGGKR